jgi:hypothetical protein
MKPYFVAALSFVGVLGSAAGAMAINNDTLAHGGADLTEAASTALIHTATVNPDGTISALGQPSGSPAVGTAGASSAGMPVPTAPPTLAIAHAGNWNATTGGSSATSAGSSRSSSGARPVATPAAGASGSVSAVTGGSSAAAPAPGSGSGTGAGSSTGNTPPAQQREHGTNDDREKVRHNEGHDSGESADD